MHLSEPIKIAYQNLMAAKWRSFLTVLGIIIGVASVIIVMAVGASAQALIVNQIKNAGSNLIGVLPGSSDEKGPPASAIGIVVTTLKYEDMQAILKKKNVPNVISTAAYVTGSASIKSRNTSLESSFQGITASYPDVENVKVEKGRFFIEEEETNLAQVAVLGYEQAQELFPNEEPVGKSITLKDHKFSVIGVMEKRGSVAFSNTDNLIYIPLFTAQKLILGINYVNFLRIKVDSEENLDQAVADVKATLREQHKIKNPRDDDFSVRNTAQTIDILTRVTDLLTYFLVAVAAISLVVGGVGVMNIMLIAVSQRIREIGLRKAVGARNYDITIQFLAESVAVAVLGGLMGVLVGVLFSYLAAVIIQLLDYDWQYIVTAPSIILSFAIAFFIGIIFGLYPARKAARVSPMEALRY